jgi:hypothetical protein
MNKTIMEKIENLKQYFDSLKINLISKIESNPIYAFLKKRREWINASFRNYTLFLLWGSISLATVRFFQMWITNSWHLINFYYMSVTFSFFVTFVLITLRYLKDKGYFKRGEENREKWRAYQNFVAEKRNLKWNFVFSRSLIVLFTLDFLFLNFYRDFHVGETLSNIGMFTSSFVFFCYVVNHFYIAYWMKKTPTPNELLLEPPNLYVKIASTKVIDKILSRRYSTRTRAERLRLFYSNNKKEIWATSLGIATVMYWATGTDRSIADYNEETTYGSRIYTTSKGGWYTTEPKIKTRAHQLLKWGVDPSELCYENSKRLNGGEVNAIYERLKNEKYPKPYMVELQNLKSNFETTQANLEVSRFDLETTKLELDNQKRRNDDLERRLANLEMSKETENK